jgi:hypothetical protein
MHAPSASSGGLPPPLVGDEVRPNVIALVRAISRPEFSVAPAARAACLPALDRPNGICYCETKGALSQKCSYHIRRIHRAK